MEDSRLVSMEKDIQYIKKESSENKDLIIKTQKMLDEKFDSFIDKLDTRIQNTEKKFIDSEYRIYEEIEKQEKKHEDKYASKYVERAFWWLVSTVFLGVLTAIGSVIFVV